MDIYGEFTAEEIIIIKSFKEFLETQVYINGNTSTTTFLESVSNLSTVYYDTYSFGGHPVLAGGFLARLLYCYNIKHCNIRHVRNLLPEDFKYLTGGDMDIFVNDLPLSSAKLDYHRAVSLTKFRYMFQSDFQFKPHNDTDHYKVKNPNIIEIGVNNNDIGYSMPALGDSKGFYSPLFLFPKQKGIQIVYTKYASRDACIEHFDYEHLKISYCLSTNALKISPLAFRCATRKILLPNNSNQAPAGYRRKKFLDMGFVENGLQPSML